MDNIEFLSERLNSGEHIKIKLLGDSISHGVGGSGFQMTKDTIIGEFGRNPNGYCWAKRFKEHIEGIYNASVANNACAGTTIGFIIQYIDTLVSTDDEFVICTIGTNNRHQYVKAGPRRSREEYEQNFYTGLLKLNELLCERNKKVIFVANIPVAPECERDYPEALWYIIHMDDINTLHKRAQEVTGFTLISLYELFSEYMKKNDLGFGDLFTDGVHPNDKGYDIVFELLLGELGI